jgi:exonuclease-1
LPVKHVEDSRASSRAENRAKALEALRQGNRAKATEFFQRCVDITPAMAHKVILTLRRCGVEFIVAPYEADAQLAYLALKGDIACVITADSDLIPYGCANVFLKMDKLGNGHLIDTSRLAEVLHGFDSDMLRVFCCLTGCDYMTPVKGLGVRGAHQLVKRYATHERIIQAVLRDSTLTPPPEFAAMLERALMTFRHQRVWCPTRQRIVPLTPFSDATDADTGDYATDADTQFLGRQLPAEQARGVCIGDLEPGTFLQFGAATATAAAAASSGAAADGDWQHVKRPVAVAAASSSSTSSTSTAAQRAQALANAQRKTALARSGTWTGSATDVPQQSNHLTNYFTPVSKEAAKAFQPPRSATSATKRTADEAVASATPPAKVHVFSRFFGTQQAQAAQAPPPPPQPESPSQQEDDDDVAEVQQLHDSSGCQSLEDVPDVVVEASQDLADLVGERRESPRVVSSSSPPQSARAVSSPQCSPPTHRCETVVLSDDDDDVGAIVASASVAPVISLDEFAFDGGGKENRRRFGAGGGRTTMKLVDRIRAARSSQSESTHASVAAMFLSEHSAQR